MYYILNEEFAKSLNTEVFDFQKIGQVATKFKNMNFDHLVFFVSPRMHKFILANFQSSHPGVTLEGISQLFDIPVHIRYTDFANGVMVLIGYNMDGTSIKEGPENFKKHFFRFY